MIGAADQSVPCRLGASRLQTLARRSVSVVAAVIVLAAAVSPWPAAAESIGEAAATAPIERLDGALLAAMKAGDRTPFVTRYRALAPVVEHVFDLKTVLEDSVGLSWSTLPETEKAELVRAFRLYTVSMYVANFDSYSGERFRVLPGVRDVGNGELVVQSRLLRSDGSPVALDYVMRRRPVGWQAVDVLTDGAISRVAVQRSEFRELLAAGGVAALASRLEQKVASLSGGMLG